jgi:peptide/nickel transport system substrate-binding protein
MLKKLVTLIFQFSIILIFTIGTLTGCTKVKTVQPSDDYSTNQITTPSPKPPQLLNEIHYINSSNSVTETDLILSGQADMISRVDSLEEVENLAVEKQISLISSSKGGSKISCVFFNLRRSPTDDLSFREAIARVINRDFLSHRILNGRVVPLNTYVPPLNEDWVNKDAAAPPFNSTQANEVLNEAGYRFDKEYKSRVNPKTNEPLSLTVLTPLRNINPILWNIGYTLTYYINGLGIKAYHIALPDYLCRRQAMESRDFDILIQDISLNQAPFGLYPLLHSSQDKNWTNAFSGVHDLELDKALEALWSSLDILTAQKEAKEIQALLVKNLPYVAVCSMPVYSAIRGDWNGIVDVPGMGISNFWTYQSISPSNNSQNSILKLIAPGGFNSLNPLIAASAAEWEVLHNIYNPLFYNDPINMRDIPILASSWDVENWTTSTNGKGMKITFHLADGIKWQDGVPFNSKDIKFCIDYIKSNRIPKFENTINLVEKVTAPDDLTVEIYLNDCGYRYLYDFNWFTFLPEHIWSNVADYEAFKPWTEANSNNQDMTKLVGQGLYILKPGDLSNGVQLYRNKNAYLVKP